MRAVFPGVHSYKTTIKVKYSGNGVQSEPCQGFKDPNLQVVLEDCSLIDIFNNIVVYQANLQQKYLSHHNWR